METHVWLFLAAIVAAAINTIAGGGGLLTFPLLMTVVEPVTADATSALALLPAYASSTLGSRKHLTLLKHWFRMLIVPSLVGGLAGALMLSWASNRSFTFAIPWLILGGTLVYLFRSFLIREASPAGGGENSVPQLPTGARFVSSFALMLIVSIYGGYFGAGIGILVIAALGMMGLHDPHSIVTLKNALTGGMRTLAVLVFVIEGKVNWSYGLPMAVGGFIGGYIGAHLMRRTNKSVIRGVIIVVGLGISGYYFWKQYGSEIWHVGSE